MKEMDLEHVHPLCYDEHIYPIKQLALWQHLFEEMGYQLSIEHQPSAVNDETVTEENVIYHAIKKDNQDDHYIIEYCRKIKNEYDF